MNTSTPTTGPTASPDQEAVTLELTGMTCAACANRIERSLNKIDGVDAAVNFATERARVRFDPTTTTADLLVGAVQRAGYGASVRPAPTAHAHAAAASTPNGGQGHDPAHGRGHDHGPDVALSVLRRRLVVAVVLGVPVVALSMIPALQFDNWQWLAFALAAPVALWAAWPFHRAAARTARHGGTTMDTLVSIGVLAAFAWSTWALLFGTAGEHGMTMRLSWRPTRAGASGHLYLEVAVTVVAFLLAGRYLEARAKQRSGRALAALADLGAKQASVLAADGSERLVPVAQLVVGDRFVVRPGGQIATDGAVESGESSVDQSLVTGESVPVDVGPGDTVVGATLNVSGRLVVRATGVGEDTALARITRLVEEAQNGKAPIQRLADRVSGVFVPVVLVIAVATFVAWLATNHSTVEAFTAAVAVLVVACPCALGLATPTALLVGTGRGAQLGILIRGPEILESTRRVDTIVLDKTGTVTTGRMALVDLTPGAGRNRAEVLMLLGALEAASEHPVARAIAEAAADAADGLPGNVLPPVGSFRSSAGLGVEGAVAGHQVLAGRPSFLAERELVPDAELSAAIDRATTAGQTVVVIAIDGAVAGVAAVADTVKPTSADAIGELRALGLRPILLSGDNEATARQIAAVVGIAPEDVVAGVLPDGKVAEIRRLQHAGRVVAMVGDGVNDAPALAEADLGIAMGTGTDAAIEASDITIVSGDLRSAARAIALSRRTLAVIKGNLFWAFAYNVAALPLAALGYLNPVIAGFAMAASSVFVVTNSLRLRSAV